MSDEQGSNGSAGGVTVSMNLADMTLNELVMLNQGLGHQIEKLREQRAYLNRKIAARIAAGERNGDGERQREREARAAAGDIGGGSGEEKPGSGDATAPGAMIEAKAT